MLLSTVFTERDRTQDPIFHAVTDVLGIDDDPQIPGRGDNECNQVVDDIDQHAQGTEPLLPFGGLSDLRLHFDDDDGQRNQEYSGYDDADVQRNQN